MLPFPPATGSKQQAFPSRYRDFAETLKLYAFDQKYTEKGKKLHNVIEIPLVRGFGFSYLYMAK